MFKLTEHPLNVLTHVLICIIFVKFDRFVPLEQTVLCTPMYAYVYGSHCTSFVGQCFVCNHTHRHNPMVIWPVWSSSRKRFSVVYSVVHQTLYQKTRLSTVLCYQHGDWDNDLCWWYCQSWTLWKIRTDVGIHFVIENFNGLTPRPNAK